MEIKETKAQKVERLKRSLNPWEYLAEIRRFAREGYGAIPPEWLGTYYRWWGVYPQGDGAGAVGGTGGEGKAVPFFMVRIRIPNGLLNSNQLRTIADLAEKYGGGVADLTVRQNIQLHWVTIEGLAEVLDGLERCGLSSLASCGDVTRNITGCPLAGMDADEICDASSLVHQATHLLAGNSEFYNLPRKFKISITGCRVWCTYPEINDIGLTAVVRKRLADPETGFSLRVGGGLSTKPHLAERLNAFVRWDQVLPVIRGIAEIFRGADVLRESRDRARLKFLFLEHGWTPEQFQEELERRIGFRLDPAEPEDPPADIYRDHTGIHPQKQDAYSYVGAAVLRGRIEPRQMRAAADLADRFASGQLRTTNMQNLLVVNVPENAAAPLADELNAVGLSVDASSFRRGAVACTGTEFCKVAITETKAFSRWLVEELEERLPGFEHHLKLNVTGCPNSCGQHWIADIGIEGKKQRVNGEMVDAYYFCVGGAVGQFASIARPIGYRCPANDVPEAIERLLRSYLELRQGDENLRKFFARHSDEKLRTFLAGRNVGKRCGQKRITQQQIHARMIDFARQGKIVVRLQSGDPLLYGRAGEEMDALRDAGVQFEVVPGITAAFAAAASAKIPLTDRRLASKVVFLTAHHCKEDAPSDFGSEISSDATLAIYMPGHDYARLQKQLLASGVDPETPCLLISRAMRPGESFHATVVGKLSLAPRVSAPSILLVGALAAPRHHTDAVIAFSRIAATRNYSAPENIPLQCDSVVGDGPESSPRIQNSGRGY